MKNDVNEKIISLYKFISGFCKAKQKNIINDNDYQWKLQISDIPNDPDNISILYSDKNVSDEENENLTDEPNYLLKVHKPENQSCPEPPECLKKWLREGWRSVKETVEIEDKIEHIDYVTGVKTVELFNDDSYRRKQLKSWLEKRKNWLKQQLLIEKTRTLFLKLYEQYGDLQREADTIEIIIANGYIKDNNNSKIYHPILTKRLSMNFDSAENTIYILNTNAKSELYSELFQEMEDINLESLSTLNSDLMEHDYHPMDRNETKKFLKNLVHEISSNSKFVEEEDENDKNNNRILMYFKPCIIVRKRLDGTVKTIEQIINNVEKTGFIPKHLLDIVSGGQLEKIEEPDESVEEIMAKADGESIDILLTKEANAEQIEIAKRIELYNAVLVQGPPGTGKTHTIANLIGHFLAEGKSILVTSYTKKALTVLKEKLPEDMQSLCVSVLDESNEDMENSIEGITEYRAKFTSVELKKQIEKLKEERLKIIDELSKIRRKIYNALDNEYKSIVLNGDEISPSKAAKYVRENKEKLDYINGDIKLYETLPLSIDELNYLYSTNTKLTDIEEKELNYGLPDPDKLIKPERFKKLIDENNKLNNLINETAEKQGWKVNTNNDLFFETDFGEFYINDLDETSINNLSEYIDDYKQCKQWVINVCCDGKKGSVYSKKWTTLIKKINETIKINNNILNKFFDKTFTNTENLNILIENKDLIEKLELKLSKKNKIGKFDLLINSNLSKIVNLNAINNKPLQTVADCEFLLEIIKLEKSREILAIEWNKLMSTAGLPKFKELDINEPEKTAEKYIDSIKKYLKWYSNDYEKLKTLLKDANIPDQYVLKIDSFDNDIAQINSIFDSLQNILPYIVEICSAKIKINNNMKIIGETVNILEGNLLINSSLCINLKKNLIDNDYEQYLEKYKEFNSVYSKIEMLSRRNELLDKLEQVAPIWANDIRTRNGIHGENKCPNNIKEAWKYKQYESILYEIGKESIDILQGKNKL